MSRRRISVEATLGAISFLASACKTMTPAQLAKVMQLVARFAKTESAIVTPQGRPS